MRHYDDAFADTDDCIYIDMPTPMTTTMNNYDMISPNPPYHNAVLYDCFPFRIIAHD